ncbi:hypothetical protein [Paludisphaera soli]|uniref:hypothetical protein n=1 Tax=Paludisphaera soli TaxID=2712865 RepID=UPI0013EC59B4|nr:hypothetical protein [Paludisphaera soli]
MTTPRCSKCSHAMDEGFILEHTQGGYLQAQWVAGPPQRTWWMGLKIRGREVRPIVSFCCSRCGHLESYAKPDGA